MKIQIIGPLANKPGKSPYPDDEALWLTVLGCLAMAALFCLVLVEI